MLGLSSCPAAEDIVILRHLGPDGARRWNRRKCSKIRIPYLSYAFPAYFFRDGISRSQSESRRKQPLRAYDLRSRIVRLQHDDARRGEIRLLRGLEHRGGNDFLALER